jgi:glycosyltransferase involved in cell wall biosynthesis
MRIWLSDGDRRLLGANGYGQISAAVSRGLIELGHDVQFQEFSDMELALFICPPGRIKFGRQVPCAAITMHELDHLPQEKADWVEILNRLDLVITPTAWNRDVWEKAGVSTAIEVAPLGIDVESYYPVTGRRCVFLCVHENLGADSSREDWRQTLRAYLGAFTSEDPVRLVVKTWSWKAHEYRATRAEVLGELGVAESQAAEVEVIDNVLSTEAMRDLYQRAWLFLKNANREGWSMPCTEALACGTPVAATRIEPLLSHLPAETRWFERGEVAELEGILLAEYARFRSHLRLAQRHDAAVMTKLVEVALERLYRSSRSPTGSSV